MFRKNYFYILLSVCLLLAGSFTIFAQNAPVTGRVVMKKADGTTVPVEGALIEVYRTDIKTKQPSDKTDKKGQFAFAGLPLGGTFVLSISAPGAKPGYFPNVKAGNEKLLITLEEGDGRRWTEEEIREAITQDAAASSNTSREPTADQKKAEAERLKLIAEHEAKKKKIETETVTISNALAEGNKAFEAKNYDLALAKWDEGITANPDFFGSAPVLLNNKGVVLKIRAVDNHNKAVKSTDPAVKAEIQAKVKQDLENALAGYNRSWTILKNAPAAEITDQIAFDKAKYGALEGLTDTYRLLVITKANPAKAAEAKDAFDAYLAIEKDAAKKAKIQLVFGDVMREAGESERAIEAYRAALATSPDNPDALAGVGLSLFNAGVVADNKAQMQEGLNFMTRFAEIAPETHPLKSSVKDAVEYLKTQEKLAPQKVTKKKT